MSNIKKMLQADGLLQEGDTSNPELNNNSNGTGENGGATPGAAAGGAAAPQEEDIAEEKLLAALNKKRGTSFTSLDEINKPAEQTQELTAEQKAAADKERRTKVRAYGLSKGKVTSDDLDNHARESTLTPYESGLARYKAARLEEAKAELKNGEALPTDAEMEEDFDDLNHQNRQDTDPKKIFANKRLEREHQAYLKERYGNVLGLDTDYDTEEQETAARTKYSALVDKALAKLEKKLPQEFLEGKNKHSYNYDVSEDSIKAVREQYATEEMFKTYGSKKGLTAEKLAEAIKLSIIQREFPNILATVAIAHKSSAYTNREAFRRGIVPDVMNGIGGGDGGETRGGAQQGTSNASRKLQEAQNQ